jgi:putative ABC transport system permease protein
VRPLIGAGFFVTPGFLPAIGARTLAGDSAWQADSGTVVITRNTVDSLWGPATSPSDVIGRMIPTRPNRGRLVRVAAVIEDLSLSDITREPVPLVFSPLMQRWAGLSLTGFVDVTGQRQPANVVRRIIAADAPELPLFDLRSARAAIDLQFADRHAMAQAAATLGSIGLVLAVVGLYAVVSAVVNSRRREIGIRGALGAAPQRILRRVLVGGLVPVVVGLPFGVAGALVIGKLLGPQLFGLESLDPLAYVSAMVLLMAAALGATLLPAWRATRISPAEVLRDE